MPPLPTLIAFCGATLLLVLLPGPNLLYILGAGITGGRRTAFAAAAGVELGTLVHVVAAAIGLSAVLRSSALAFSTVKYLGVVYLVYLGVRAIRAPAGDHATDLGEPRSTAAAIRQGAIVNVLNPKVSLFFLAFLPQFIAADQPATGQVLALGLIFFLIALTVDLVYAAVSGGLGRWIARHPRLFRHQQRAAGVIYLGLAGLAATQGGRAGATT